MTPGEPSASQLRRDVLPLSGRVALVTGASLFLHHYTPHDHDQPWEPTPAAPRPSSPA